MYDAITSIQWMATGTGFGKYSAFMIPDEVEQYAVDDDEDMVGLLDTNPMDKPEWSPDKMGRIEAMDAHLRRA